MALLANERTHKVSTGEHGGIKQPMQSWYIPYFNAKDSRTIFSNFSLFGDFQKFENLKPSKNNSETNDLSFESPNVELSE